MRIVLVRHATVETDPAVAPSQWVLSDAGRAAARALAREGLWRSIQRIFTSPEPKALETAHILAGPNGMTVTVVEDLHEVRRPANQWFGDEYPGGYPAAVRTYLAHPNETTHGWERPVAAQERIRTCIDELRRWEPDSFALVGHGLTLSLYVASVTATDPAAVWPAIGLPDYAILDPDTGRLLRTFGG